MRCRCCLSRSAFRPTSHLFPLFLILLLVLLFHLDDDEAMRLSLSPDSPTSISRLLVCVRACVRSERKKTIRGLRRHRHEQTKIHDRPDVKCNQLRGTHTQAHNQDRLLLFHRPTWTFTGDETRRWAGRLVWSSFCSALSSSLFASLSSLYIIVDDVGSDSQIYLSLASGDLPPVPLLSPSCSFQDQREDRA